MLPPGGSPSAIEIADQPVKVPISRTRFAFVIATRKARKAPSNVADHHLRALLGRPCLLAEPIEELAGALVYRSAYSSISSGNKAPHQCVSLSMCFQLGEERVDHPVGLLGLDHERRGHDDLLTARAHDNAASRRRAATGAASRSSRARRRASPDAAHLGDRVQLGGGCRR